MRFFVTSALVLANLAVFGLELAGGGSERPDVLVGLGAMVPSLIRDYDQSWRLVSAGFLHIGATHLLVNLVALILLGHIAERFYGARRFLVLYVVAAVGGATASYWLGRAHISAGASGAIFGLVGAGLFVWFRHGRHRSREGVAELRPLVMGLAVITVVNAVYGFWQEGIDSWNHLGGILTGFAAASVLDPVAPVVRLHAQALNGLFAASVGLLGFAGVSAASNPVSAVDPVGEELARYFNHDTLDYRRGFGLLADMAERGTADTDMIPLAERLIAGVEAIRPETPGVQRLHARLLAHARCFGEILEQIREVDGPSNADPYALMQQLSRCRAEFDAWHRAVREWARKRGYTFD
ncbi:MAG: rhomboid protease GluP [Myxococcota bacterium]